jgi:hypothetical protein
MWNSQQLDQTVYQELARQQMQDIRNDIQNVRQEPAPEPYRPPQATLSVNFRARELLLSKLTQEQRETFERNNWFVVTGGKTNTRYRLEGHTLIANIVVLSGDNAAYRLCGHCHRSLPMSDHLLAQKLMLEYDEEEFLKIANRHAA